MTNLTMRELLDTIKNATDDEKMEFFRIVWSASTTTITLPGTVGLAIEDVAKATSVCSAPPTFPYVVSFESIADEPTFEERS